MTADVIDTTFDFRSDTSPGTDQDACSVGSLSFMGCIRDKGTFANATRLSFGLRSCSSPVFPDRRRIVASGRRV
jgi:hypothetical protein